MTSTEHSRTARTTDVEAALNDLTQRGVAAIRNTQAGLEGVVADAGEKGREALKSARQVRDTFADAVLKSIKTRPYTTLAIAGFVGFVYGAMRRR